MRTFDIETDVTLECPCCRAYKTVPRTPDLPAKVRLIEIICPDCDDGGFHTETWFSAPGVEVSQDREPFFGTPFRHSTDCALRDGDECTCGSFRIGQPMTDDPPKPPEALNRFVKVVLAYRPKPKSKPAKARARLKKSKAP